MHDKTDYHPPSAPAPPPQLQRQALLAAIRELDQEPSPEPTMKTSPNLGGLPVSPELTSSADEDAGDRSARVNNSHHHHCRRWQAPRRLLPSCLLDFLTACFRRNGDRVRRVFDRT